MTTQEAIDQPTRRLIDLEAENARLRQTITVGHRLTGLTELEDVQWVRFTCFPAVAARSTAHMTNWISSSPAFTTQLVPVPSAMDNQLMDCARAWLASHLGAEVLHVAVPWFHDGLYELAMLVRVPAGAAT